jgi:phospholipid/cholesterol/gamma-HCH transport system substrate-binding protein
MESKIRYVAVGFFVVLLGTASVAGFLWLARGIDRTAYDRYRAYFRESVSGLGPNAVVKYRGVEVGRVREIVLNPGNVEEVRLTLDIVRGTPVKTDTVATLKLQGLTGLAFLDLSGGSQGAPLLSARPGERYPVIQTGPSLLHRIDTDVTRLISGVTDFTEEARALIDPESREELKRILRDLATLTDTLAKRSDAVDRGMAEGARALENIARITDRLEARSPEIVDNLGAGAATFRDASTEARDAAVDIRKAAVEVQRAAGDVQVAGREVARAGRELTAMVGENRQDLGRFTRQGLPEIQALVADLRQLTAQLQRLGRQLEQEPDSVILGRHPVPPGPGERGGAGR